MKIEKIAAIEIDKFVGNNDVIIVDVRSAKEFMKRHITGAVNIPGDQIDRISLNRNKEIILYCERGSSSIVAASKLLQKGYRVKSVVGGLNAYHGSFIS